MSTKRCWISSATKISTKSGQVLRKNTILRKLILIGYWRHEKLLRGEPMPKQIDIDIIRKRRYYQEFECFDDGCLLGWRAQQHQTLYSDVTENKKMSEKLLVSERFASIGQLSTASLMNSIIRWTSILGFSNMTWKRCSRLILKRSCR